MFAWVEKGNLVACNTNLNRTCGLLFQSQELTIDVITGCEIYKCNSRTCLSIRNSEVFVVKLHCLRNTKMSLRMAMSNGFDWIGTSFIIIGIEIVVVIAESCHFSVGSLNRLKSPGFLLLCRCWCYYYCYCCLHVTIAWYGSHSNIITLAAFNSFVLKDYTMPQTKSVIRKTIYKTTWIPIHLNSQTKIIQKSDTSFPIHPPQLSRQWKRRYFHRIGVWHWCQMPTNFVIIINLPANTSKSLQHSIRAISPSSD